MINLVIKTTELNVIKTRKVKEDHVSLMNIGGALLFECSLG